MVYSCFILVRLHGRKKWRGRTYCIISRTIPPHSRWTEQHFRQEIRSTIIAGCCRTVRVEDITFRVLEEDFLADPVGQGYRPILPCPGIVDSEEEIKNLPAVVMISFIWLIDSSPSIRLPSGHHSFAYGHLLLTSSFSTLSLRCTTFDFFCIQWSGQSSFNDI